MNAKTLTNGIVRIAYEVARPKVMQNLEAKQACNRFVLLLASADLITNAIHKTAELD